jgi:GAF domain-containing protein
MANVENLGARLHDLRTRREALYHSDDQTTRANALLDFYTHIMTKVTESERCSVFINDPQHDRVWLKAGTGLHEADIEVPREGSVVGQVIATGKPLIVTGLDMKSGAHKQTDAKTGFVTRNILCVPIKNRESGEVTGAFQVLNKLHDADFTEEDRAMATEVAGHLQREVDTIYLDQEIFELSEKLEAAATRGNSALYFAIAAVAAAVVVWLLLR